jgi:AraC family transcriptional regulator of adaptative response/methylated-DNA-[protein]-cysteine methyltransferase
MNKDRARAVKELRGHWQKSKLTEDDLKIRPFIRKIFNSKTGDEPLHLHLNGTNFQIKVWEALLRIPEGHAVTYEDIAAHIGRPKASRAVGNAVGQNPVPLIIPCHRVIKKIGDFGNYHYGSTRKKIILGWEAVKADINTAAAL